jgi:hypothetical protein
MADDKTENKDLPLQGVRQGPGWKDLQNALANLIHCNITILDPQGKKFLEPSRHTAFCWDQLEKSKPPVPSDGQDCVFQSFESCMLQNAALHTCRHKVNFSTLKLMSHDRVAAVVILGPFLTGKGKFLELDAFAREPHARDFANGPDRIRDLTVLSSEKLAEIHNFIRSFFETLVVLSHVNVPTNDSPGS